MLFRQALRGIWRKKRTFAACILLIALGVASYTGFTATSRQLVKGMYGLYEETGFGEAFATVKAIPYARAERLDSLDGVAQAWPSLTVDTRVEHDGDTILTLHAISYNPQDTAALDRMVLLSGETPTAGEIVISQEFFDAQNLSLGDTITLVANGKQVRPVISGTALSAAYIIPSGEGMSGDGKTSGYAYMPTPQVDALSDITGAANHITFLLEEGADYSRVEAALEKALDRYGLVTLYSRDDHPSHDMTWQNFAGLEGTAGMIAFIFFSVSILVLYILLLRVIEQERIQVGTLKAFGVSPGKILGLYLGYGGLVGLIGGLIGCAGGIGIAAVFTSQYLVFFPMPPISFQLETGVLLSGLLIAVVSGMFGALAGAKSVLGLSPAEAMRPAAPVIKRKRAAKENRLANLLFSTTGFMALRSMSRAKFRSGFILVGMGISFSILVFMSSYAAIADSLMMEQFKQIQLYDIKLTLESPAAYTAALEGAKRLDGVSHAEGVLELGVTVYNGHLQTEAFVTGMEPDTSLLRLYDSVAKTTLESPGGGAVISGSLAQRLDAAPGDTLYFTTGMTGERRIPFVVEAIAQQNTGRSAYMNLDDLCSLLGAPKSVNSVLLAADNAASVKNYFGGAAGTPTVSDQRELQAAVQLELDSTLGVNVGIFCIIGLGVAIAIIASTASISLSERGREFATLRVLGMSPGEIGKIMGFEYWALTILGFLPGIPLALGLQAMIVSSMSTDAMFISPGIDTVHYLVAAGVCLLAVTITNHFSVRRIAKLDMPDVLKERE